MSSKLNILVISLLLLGNLAFGLLYFQAQRELQGAVKILEKEARQEKIISFLQLLIDKVLNSNVEITFEDRFKMENLVRSLEDPVALAEWQKFVGSESDEAAQANFKTLLKALMDRLLNE